MFCLFVVENTKFYKTNFITDCRVKNFPFSVWNSEFEHYLRNTGGGVAIIPAAKTVDIELVGRLATNLKSSTKIRSSHFKTHLPQNFVTAQKCVNYKNVPV